MEGELQRAFGQALRAERHRRGISQEHWGEVLGMHRTRAGAIERGEQNLTLRSVERIAERLGIEPLVLLAGPAESSAGAVLRAAHEGDDPGPRSAPSTSRGRRSKVSSPSPARRKGKA